MTLASFGIFAIALFIAAGSPGPSIAAMVSRVLTRGWRDVLPFVAAMWIGEAIWITVTVAGLATLAEAYYTAFQILKYLGVAYLIWMAIEMWRASAELIVADKTEARSHWKMFMAGMAVTLGNPKIMVFYLALLPSLIDLGQITLADWGLLILVAVMVMAVIDLFYMTLASQVRGLLRTPRIVRIANRVSATVMGGAAALIARN